MLSFIFYITLFSWILILDFLFLGYFSSFTMKTYQTALICFVAGYVISRVDYYPSSLD
jgi:hypothetical protein